MPWHHLPQELRDMILNLVAKDVLFLRDYSGNPIGKVAPYAGVSPEWQIFFEKITFRHFTLTTSALRKFDRFTSGDNNYRRNYVRDISFTILLPRYSCRRWLEAESSADSARNNGVFTCSMQTLLGVLSTWAPNGGLTLELNTKSPADSEHSFSSREMKDDFPFKHWNWQDRFAFLSRYVRCRAMSSVFQRSPPGYGLALTSAYRPALERYLGSLLEFKDGRLPRVEAVTSLLQRHQFKRQLSPAALGTLMQKSLVQLSSFRLERWCRTSVRDEEKYLMLFKERVLPCLPKSLETFHYYAQRLGFLSEPPGGRVKPLSIVEVLSTQGLQLKQMSVVEPYDSTLPVDEMKSIIALSLSKPIETVGWHKLERVCFRSVELHPRPLNKGLMNDLLALSASIAERLPKLLSWEIYNTRTPDTEACLFRYSVQRSSVASISWESWWQPIDFANSDYLWDPRVLSISGDDDAFSFDPHVVSAWDKVATLHTGYGVTVLVDEATEDNIKRIKDVFAEEFELKPVHPLTEFLEGY